MYTINKYFIIIQKMKSYFLTVMLCSSAIYLLLLHLFTSHRVNEVLPFVNKSKSMKYILLWTSKPKERYIFKDNGQLDFIERNCSHVNCFVTSNKLLLGDYVNFEVIVFPGPQLEDGPDPEIRKPRQKYVFASTHPSDIYPICYDLYDNFFNWTLTYKFDSELQWRNIIIRDTKNNTIGPKKNMSWLTLEQMDPVTKNFKNKLKTKKKAAVWFVSNCILHKHDREEYIIHLIKELYKYNRSELDIYGKCGKDYLSKSNEKECGHMLEDTYYFYLSFENSFSEDYVTETLLHALNYNVVPIVYGGANYTRFMPDGIYLNARELGVKKLAAKMNELMHDPEKYAQYFRWKNHYSYHKVDERLDTNVFCKFCEMINDEEAMKEITMYKNFTGWWNTPDHCSDML